MIIGRLTALGLASVAVCGAAWGQPPTPKYDEALKAVSNAGCERSETETYVQFACKQAEAIWYFTQPGRPEHPAYRVMPSYKVVPPRGTVPMDGRSLGGSIGAIGWADSADHEAWQKWVQQIFRVWITSTPAVWPDPAQKPRSSKPHPAPPA